MLTDTAPLQALLGADGKFLVMSGQEVSQVFADPTHPDLIRPAHVNAINTPRVIWPMSSGPGGEKAAPAGTSIADTFARNIGLINEAGGVAQINHPNFRWFVGLADMAAVAGGTLFELWSGHPLANNLGGADGAGGVAPSTEELWDAVLTRGTVFWGVGSDDAHHYDRAGDPDASSPGRAWIAVRADALTPASITASLRRGEFYASTGVALDEIALTSGELSIAIRTSRRYGDANYSIADDARYRTRFISRGGRVLADIAGPRPRYTCQPGDGYVRAVVTDSRGRQAWTQPIFMDARAPRSPYRRD